MPKCIVCNKQISEETYFCDKCLTEEIGESPKPSVFGLLSWLVSLPFQAHQIITPPARWTEGERQQWAIKRVDQIITRFSQLPIEPVVNKVCFRAGLRDQAAREKVLTELQNIRSELRNIESKKDIKIWAPWDIVFQPGIQILIVMMGILGLFLLAFSF